MTPSSPASPNKTQESSLTPNRLSKPRLILVEGPDDKAVIEGLLAHHGLGGFQIQDMEGNTNWTDKIRALMLDGGFPDVIGLGLVRDADSSASRTWQSCKATLENLGLPVPDRRGELRAGNPAICVTIVPSNEGSGAIEELCVASFSQDRMNCVDSFFNCADGSRAGRVSHDSKARVQAYLSCLVPPIRDLRIAARANILPWSNAAFDELRRFLHNLEMA
jgi:hypothetical protein